ncbi:MAG: cytochrome-c peroxidase [Chitinophagales bacterium]|nr:c-type cytochrome [Sphingobacteriales bacterium]
MNRILKIIKALRACISIFVLSAFFTSCSPEEKEDTGNSLTQLIRPKHFPVAHYTHSNNPYTREGFELGKRLFFDPILSRDTTISCASCHHQSHAFADRGIALSIGIKGGVSSRNSPPIFNMAWSKSFMWDGGINHIEIMPFAPIINPKEMDDNLNNIIRKLNQHPNYPKLFQTVFRKTNIDDQQLFWALAQYMSNLVSANSRYDLFIAGKENFTTSEMKGLKLFRQHCESCHKEPLMTDYGFHNNGLDEQFKDQGRYRISQNEIDLGRFKTPSLRNVELTAPYMHDGRIASLSEVIEHYSSKIKSSPTLSSPLGEHVGGFQFSDEEKDALVDFLHTLTDEEFITNKALVYP